MHPFCECIPSAYVTLCSRTTSVLGMSGLYFKAVSSSRTGRSMQLGGTQHRALSLVCHHSIYFAELTCRHFYRKAEKEAASKAKETADAKA